MDIGQAVNEMKEGGIVARDGWKGENIYLVLIHSSRSIANTTPLSDIYTEGTEIDGYPYVAMKTADNKTVHWSCSQSDLLAEDWYILDDSDAMPF